MEVTEYPAKIINNQLVIGAVREQKPNGDVIMHVPSLHQIQEATKKYLDKKPIEPIEITK